VASGWLGDAVPGPVARLLMLWTTLTGVSLALFPVAQAPTTLVVLAVAYGFTSGALTPVAFSVLPELVGTGRMYCGLGLVQMVESIGGLLGAPLSGKGNGVSRWARAAMLYSWGKELFPL
jgi:MCP family monocarboxylic acid transporter-like MFS transporter 13